MERFAYSLLALTLALIALPSGAAAATTTLDNLQAGFNGESNAHSRYLAFAEKADQEGYGEVASLFRAAAKAEEVHAANHAAVIKKMGGTAQATDRGSGRQVDQGKPRCGNQGRVLRARHHVSGIPQAGSRRGEQRCCSDLQLRKDSGS